jgi:hypothetical protein
MVGEQNSVQSDDDTEQNIKHLFATGTILSFSNFAFNFGFEYTLLNWHRHFQTLAIILDDYKEKKYTLFGEVVYHWQ